MFEFVLLLMSVLNVRTQRVTALARVLRAWRGKLGEASRQLGQGLGLWARAMGYKYLGRRGDHVIIYGP